MLEWGFSCRSAASNLAGMEWAFKTAAEVDAVLKQPRDQGTARDFVVAGPTHLGRPFRVARSALAAVGDRVVVVCWKRGRSSARSTGRASADDRRSPTAAVVSLVKATGGV